MTERLLLLPPDLQAKGSGLLPDIGFLIAVFGLGAATILLTVFALHALRIAPALGTTLIVSRSYYDDASPRIAGDYGTDMPDRFTT